MAAAVLAFEWRDVTVGFTGHISHNVARWFGGSKAVVLAMNCAFDALPWVFIGTVMTFGLLGRLPRTKKAHPVPRARPL